ncbi:epoxide hydrolase [Gymnopilus junonius]|uniref:Epoxide hydrolase n=1 Tax=Gymnopilus junonius TaxID=109634 RepID=A0A9P5TPT0_GYMJU|nr:epoxide hydrolase [Gymnopilus junonius]
MFKAVIFDIGGVVLQSPFTAIAQYENKLGLPAHYINCSITGRGRNGAWQRFERGELELFDFYKAFGHDLSDSSNGNIWYKEYCERRGFPCPELPQKLDIDGRELFGAMMQATKHYEPYMRSAIWRLRAAGKYRIIALTNNFAKIDVPAEERDFLGWNQGTIPDHLRALFDDFCDSSVYGLRKPEPEFYLLACKRNGIKPSEAIFLDDIGLNLKAAKALGMETILVVIGKTLEAVKELEKKVGLDLTSPALDSRL